MNAIAKLLALLLLPVATWAAEVSLQDGALTIDIPDEFVALTDEQSAEVFTRGNVPDASFANDDRSVSIAVNFSVGAAAPDQLEQLKDDMEAVLRTQPDLQFIERGMTVVNGQRWVHFEFTSVQAGDPAHNHIYLTSFRGRMLALSFNAKRVAYDANEAALEASFRSIRLVP